jgi:hypothetical protein
MGKPEMTAKPIDDQWIHRSFGMRCWSCMFFVPKKEGGSLGRCRRHAPTLGGWPAAFVNDWCGDHKLDENKI